MFGCFHTCSFFKFAYLWNSLIFKQKFSRARYLDYISIISIGNSMLSTFECMFIQISRGTMLLLINNLHKNGRDNCSFINLRL
jgi:hypothetical protein